VRPRVVEIAEEKKRSRPLAFGKSSKSREERTCSIGGEKLSSNQAEGKI
jgi:hypothetical protein